MPKPIGVTRSVRWRNAETGATVSAFSSCPWHNEEDAINWELETVGWVPVYDNGTRGNGKAPFKSEEEAREWLAANK